MLTEADIRDHARCKDEPCETCCEHDVFHETPDGFCRNCGTDLVDLGILPEVAV